MLRLLVILLVLPGAAGSRGPDESAASVASPAAFQIKRRISLTIDHGLGAAEAKRRATERFESLRTQFAGQAGASTMVWTGETADVRVTAYGQLTTATVMAHDTSLEIRVALPPSFAPLGGNIQSFLQKTAVDTLKP